MITNIQLCGNQVTSLPKPQLPATMSEVYILEAITPYEGGSIVGVYSEKKSADLAKIRIERAIQKYDERREKLEEKGDDSWLDLKFPAHYGKDIFVTSHKLLTPSPSKP